MFSWWGRRHRFLWWPTFLIISTLIFFENLSNHNDFVKKKIKDHFHFRRSNFKGFDAESYISITLFSYHLNWNDFKWYSHGIVPILVFEWYYRNYRSVKKCLRVSGNVFGTSKCLQQSFKDFKNLQTVQIIIRITLTIVTSVLSKHILHTLSNVSPPIGWPGDDL